MIKLININKNFKQRVVLSDISLPIEKNEFSCIIGESRVGKQPQKALVCTNI